MPTPELYLRATAVAGFCPIMQYHSEYNHHRTAVARPHAVEHRRARPATSSVIPIFRRFVRAPRAARARISPSKPRVARDGKPLMRALCFEVDGDERIWDFPEQCFLGDDLLVAPVTEAGVADVAASTCPPANGSTPGTARQLTGAGRGRASGAARPRSLCSSPPLVQPDSHRSSPISAVRPSPSDDRRRSGNGDSQFDEREQAVRRASLAVDDLTLEGRTTASSSSSSARPAAARRPRCAWSPGWRR